ncbi:hypothetical protein AAMO2058_001262400 [Amorphochlora amoebiformis]
MERDLLAWLRSLGYRHPPPSEDELKKICRGDMRKLWRHFIDEVLSVDAARHIRGNIKIRRILHHTPSNAKIDQLRAKKRDKLAQLTQLKSKMSAVRKELGTLGKDLVRVEATITEAKEKISASKQKSILFNALRVDINEKMKQLHSHVKKIKEQSFIPKEMSANTKEISADAHRLRMERDCDQITQKLCEANSSLPLAQEPTLKQRLDSYGNGKSNGKTSGSRSAISELKVNLAEHMCSASKFVNSLVRIAEAKGRKLTADTNKIDIKADLAALNIGDASKASMPSQTDYESAKQALRQLQVLVSRRQREHISRFVETEEARNELRKMADKRGMERGKEGLVAEIQSSKKQNRALKAQIMFLDEKVRFLEVERKLLMDSKREATIAFQKVDRLTRLRKKRFGQIRQFIDATQSISKGLSSLSTSLCEFTSQDIQKLLVDTQSLARTLTGRYDVEVRQFSTSISLDGSLRRHLKWSKIADLAPFAMASCHLDRFDKKTTAVEGLLRALRFPVWGSPSHLVERVAEGLEERGRLKAQSDVLLSYLERLQEPSMETPDRFATAILEKCEKVPPIFKSWAEKLSRSSEETVVQRNARVASARRNLQAWYEQPAQYQPTWIKVGGKGLEEWLSLMEGANARLQELMRK